MTQASSKDDAVHVAGGKGSAYRVDNLLGHPELKDAALLPLVETAAEDCIFLFKGSLLASETGNVEAATEKLRLAEGVVRVLDNISPLKMGSWWRPYLYGRAEQLIAAMKACS